LWLFVSSFPDSVFTRCDVAKRDVKKLDRYLGSGFVDLRATALNTRGPGLEYERTDLVVDFLATA
jgi:hypothetical protein